jgi:hypothetical protein
MNGTDGIQFAPEMDDDAVGSVTVFSSDLSRTINFIYEGDSHSQFKGFETLQWTFDPTQFQNATTNPANANFMINVGGTSNLTSTYGIPMFASFANFYGIADDPEVQMSVPINNATN